MNFLKTDMAGTEPTNVEQAVEDHSPTSGGPLDTAPRRASDDSGKQTNPFKYDMFGLERPDGAQETPMTMRDRRMSKEWDASKVPPSRFQKREGSIHATPPSRDGHVDRNKLKDFAEKYNKGKKGERRKSQS
ncbi:hypothetical protein ABW19_dt0205082 [Dactylella cylindrospora]|nr:hypothetical protein ABW19_dt0205082 [Dactylella cylindrospora]